MKIRDRPALVFLFIPDQNKKERIMDMNGRERLLTALRGERPDKVPVTLFIQSQGHFLTQLAPEADPWDFDAAQKRIIDYSAD